MTENENSVRSNKLPQKLSKKMTKGVNAVII